MMAIEPVDPREALRKLADLYIDELLKTPEKDLLDDARSDPALGIAGIMAREAYLQAQKLAGKHRLAAARQAVDQHRSDGTKPLPAVDIEKARTLLKRISANDPAFKGKFTLAARNLEELSDVEIVSIMTDLRSLGVLPDDADQ
ncbi:hypothetical protein [Trinickia sp. EG282A]|uniref:hypothetical protein n=1 Tax=Trinickia sp. EG282A TaxID=3237013 RepID=UPI0034D1F10A